MHTQPHLSSPGHGLKAARQARRWSQLELSLRVGVSQRHLSYIETGRAKPSRHMLLALTDALELPLGQRNALLLAAGYAPHFGQRPLTSVELSPVRDALARLLEAHEPQPAMVLDAEWNVVLANRGAEVLVREFGRTKPLVAPPGEPPLNMLRHFFLDDGPRGVVVNFDEVAAAMWLRLRHEAALHPPLADLMREIEPALPASLLKRAANAAAQASPVLSTRFATSRGELAFFSAFTTFGTPQDITVASLRVEHFFPADARTAEAMRSLVEGDAGARGA
jgi:transcriptional regulator with XRE-family HTH domain